MQNLFLAYYKVRLFGFWNPPNTPVKVVESNKAKILRDLKFQTDKQLLKNRPDTVVVDGDQKIAAVTDVAKPASRRTSMKISGATRG